MEHIYNNYSAIGIILAIISSIYFLFKKDIEAILFIALAYQLWGLILPISIIVLIYSTITNKLKSVKNQKNEYKAIHPKI